MTSMDIQEQYRKVFQYCSSRIASPETAEDLTQETFLRFLEHPEYQGNGKEMQYLYTIARNLCIDEYRKAPDEAKGEPLQADRQAEGWIDRLAVREILDGLPEEEREIIVLRYVAELSVREISHIFGVSWFAMNRRIRHILSQMRKDFEKEGSV